MTAPSCGDGETQTQPRSEEASELPAQEGQGARHPRRGRRSGSRWFSAKMLSNFPASPIVAHFVLCPAMLSQAAIYVICDSCCRVAGLPQPPCSIASRLQMADGLGASLTLNAMEQLATTVHTRALRGLVPLQSHVVVNPVTAINEATGGASCVSRGPAHRNASHPTAPLAVVFELAGLVPRNPAAPCCVPWSHSNTVPRIKGPIPTGILSHTQRGYYHRRINPRKAVP